MKKTTQVIFTIIAVVSIFASLWALMRAMALERRITNEECRKIYKRCEWECRKDQSTEFTIASLMREFALDQYNDQLQFCNMLPPAIKQMCISSARQTLEERLQRANNRVRLAIDKYRYCRLNCAENGTECQEATEFEPGKLTEPFNPDDPDGDGKADMVPVLEVCTKLNMVCDDCWMSLCPRTDFSFKSDYPIESELVIFNVIDRTVRTLATGVNRDSLSVIKIPQTIPVSPVESLYFRFTPTSNRSLRECRVRVAPVNQQSR
jgi:hypothetical protein